MDGRPTKIKTTIKDITITAMLIAILVAQKLALSMIPNVQLSVFLMVLYAKKLGFIRTSIIILLYTLIDSILMGSFNIIFTSFTFLGWMFTPIIICTIGRKINKAYLLAGLGVLCSFLYSWTYLIPSVIVSHVDIQAYFIADVLFEIILAGCGFVTILFLYQPCSTLFDKLKITNKKYL